MGEDKGLDMEYGGGYDKHVDCGDKDCVDGIVIAVEDSNGVAAMGV